MLHAAALLAGCFLIALGAVAAVDRPLAAAALVASACVLWALRFGGLWRGLSWGRLGAVAAAVTSAIRIVRKAFAADMRASPALVRLKPNLASAAERATFAAALASSSEWVVIESTRDGVLAHVLDERAAEANALRRIEAWARAVRAEP